MHKTARSQRPFALAALVAVFALGALTACITKDDTLGANLVPEDQQLKAGYAVLQSGRELRPKRYVETRLYQTDSIVTSNLAVGYFGTAHNDTVGLHSAGFLSQFYNYYAVDEGYFGYRPLFDSAQIFLSLSGFGRDTVTEQHFEVYEVVDNAYLTEKPVTEGNTERDTVFYGNFDPRNVSYLGGRSVVGDTPLFTFKLGTENGGPGPATTAVTMQPTEAGREFIQRLMLQTGDHAGDYSVYDPDNIAGWSDVFKGLYIKPADSDEAAVNGSAETKGTVYATDLAASGLAVYGRNRVGAHPELIQDTIGMVYYFYNSDNTDFGNVSVNTLKHDYDGSHIDLATARAYNPDGTRNTNRPEVTQTYVEGLGGVVTEITFTQEFFDGLQALIDSENASSGKNFRTLAFTQVLMEVYFPGGQYDWEQLNGATAGPLIRLMNSAPGRLGMYTNYWRRLYIADYNYTYESYYSTSLPYGGYINRSHGCYRMDITGHVQQLWNAYVEAKEASADGTVDLEQLSLRRVYLGPEATDLFTNSYTILQGQAAGTDEAGSGESGDEAPIRFAIAYNLVR